MDKQRFKDAYQRLPASDRQEIAHWILDQELGKPPGMPPWEGVRPGVKEQNRAAFPARILAGAFILILLAGAGWSVCRWRQDQARLRAAETAAEREARERAEPRSPKNLAFLKDSVGKEITIRGIPEDCEVGYLFFSREHASALRLNFFADGVVLMQSGELEELVRQKQEIQMTGVVARSPQDQALEIQVGSLSRLKKIGTP
jgi:hypothetical protein